MPTPIPPPPPELQLREVRKPVRNGKRTRDTARVAESDELQPSDVPPSTALLSSRFRCELQRIWFEGRTGAENADSSASGVVEVPAFKVGSAEMYRRFPQQYDLLMRRHDCSAVQQYLQELLSTLQQTATPCVQDATGHGAPEMRAQTVRVADVGCGTGRIACMASRHPAVGALYCYDGEAAMLHQCFRNVVRSVAEVRADVHKVRIIPTATSDGKDDDSNDVVVVSDDCCVCIGDDSLDGDAAVELCARPISFTDVQRGFFASHPRCHLVVCAWSLSYVMRASWGGDNWHAAIDTTLKRLIDLLVTTKSAALVVIETLGTDSTVPRRQNTLLQRLEEHYGFERRWVRTDYNFRDTEEAVRLTRFFFGEAMAKKMEAAGRTTLPECTGIWTLWRKGGCSLA